LCGTKLPQVLIRQLETTLQVEAVVRGIELDEEKLFEHINRQVAVPPEEVTEQLCERHSSIRHDVYLTIEELHPILEDSCRICEIITRIQCDKNLYKVPSIPISDIDKKVMKRQQELKLALTERHWTFIDISAIPVPDYDEEVKDTESKSPHQDQSSASPVAEDEDVDESELLPEEDAISPSRVDDDFASTDDTL
jgi:hypothetical protein